MVVISVVSSNRIRSSFYIFACIHRTSYLRLSITSKLVVGLMVLKNGYWRHRNHEELNQAVKTKLVHDVIKIVCLYNREY